VQELHERSQSRRESGAAMTEGEVTINLDPAGQMSSMRTTMSFQRTRMSADRTLMSILRTALSMIGFGFTIYSFFTSMVQLSPLGGAVHLSPARFGLALTALGVLLLALGIANHVRFMLELRKERRQFAEEGLISGKDEFPVSLILIIAMLLLLLGLFAVLSIIFQTGGAQV
jgi:putative membrane protein